MHLCSLNEEKRLLEKRIKIENENFAFAVSKYANNQLCSSDALYVGKNQTI